MEVELKLLLSPADNDKLRQHPLLTAHARAQPRVQQLSARYFDTPDLHLMRHGAGLRVRKADDGSWTQTMKAGGSVHSGLHQRNEWEGQVDRPWPRLGKLRKLIGEDRQWLAVLDATDLKERLEPLFAVTVERHVWDLDVDGSHIEMVLDQGRIERHGHHVPVNEIELELKDGDPASLFSFALQLHQHIPVRVSNTNKAERGCMLCRQTGTVPYRAQPLQLDASATVADALQAVLGNCLQHIQHNETAVIEGDDAETLHQMRVGVRRLRSALKLFGPVAPCLPDLLEDIGWLGTQLGAARDWDVLLTSTLAQVEATPGGKGGLLDLQAHALDAARAARQRAAEALLSTRYSRLLLALGLWMQQQATEPELQAPAADYVQWIGQRLHKKLLKRALRMDDSDATSIHRTRIAAKRARYAMEFFHTLYRGKAVRDYLKTLSTLQDELGQHNDLVVADRMLQELAQQDGAAAGVDFARGYLRALQAQRNVDPAEIRRQLHALRQPRAI
jgi:inorganic triphosphatase YgiF